MATINVILDARRLKKDGSAPVKVAVCVGRRSKYLSTGFSVRPDDWDAASALALRSAPGAAALNRSLERVKARAMEAFYGCVASGGPCDLESLSMAVWAAMRPAEAAERAEKERAEREAAQRAERASLVRAAEAFLATKDSAGKSAESYRCMLRHVRAYDAGASLEVRRSWLLGLDAHMAEAGVGVNGRAVYMRNLRAVFNFAIDEGWTVNYPFRKFRIKTVETAKRCLHLPELRALFALEVEEWIRPYLDVWRLSFLLMGVNMKDLLLLPPDALQQGRLVFNRAKTGRLLSMKVEPEAMEIIERYRGEAFLLSFMDTRAGHKQFLAQCNHALGCIGTGARKGRRADSKPLFPGLTSYWARHSWATAAAALGVGDAVIAQALGHASAHRVTAIYIDRDVALVDAANRMVIDAVLGSV